MIVDEIIHKIHNELDKYLITHGKIPELILLYSDLFVILNSNLWKNGDPGPGNRNLRIKGILVATAYKKYLDNTKQAEEDNYMVITSDTFELKSVIAPKCECGALKTNTLHSHWCPTYV